MHEVAPEESEKYELLEYILRGLQISCEMTMGAAFLLLREYHKVTADDVVAVLRGMGSFVEGRLALLKSGIDAYLRGDYIAALHILIPQIQGVIRDLAGQIGVPTVAIKEAGIRLVSRSLDELLGDSRLRQRLGDDFVTMLEAVLTDPLGWRLRHRLSHGNMTNPHEFTRQTTEIALYILLQLANYRVVPTDAPATPGENNDQGGYRSVGKRPDNPPAEGQHSPE